MKILMVNTFHYNRGGDSVYAFELSDLLKRTGNHKVIDFAMSHPVNFISQYSEFFVPEIDFQRELKEGTLRSRTRVLKRAIYSNIAKKKLSQLLDRQSVDIAHIHSIHGHITPSIFHTLKSRDIPIVWTLHDYFLLCPNSTFFSNNKVCEACKGGKFYNVLVKKCRKRSYTASLVVMVEEYVHRLLGLLKIVDFFITPSQFLKHKLIEYGFPSCKVICIHNFIGLDNADVSSNDRDYILYSGRLSYEKGLKVLIKAVSLCNSVKLLIAGDGPLRIESETTAQQIVPHRVEFLGHLNRGRLRELIDGAMFIVMPSEWYENFPYSILEAFARRKCVVGSRLGGIPELVRDYETGLLYEPGSPDDLAEKIEWLIEHPKERKAMGNRARVLIEEKCNPDLHYKRLMDVYDMALKNHGKDTHE